LSYFLPGVNLIRKTLTSGAHLSAAAFRVGPAYQRTVAAWMPRARTVPRRSRALSALPRPRTGVPTAVPIAPPLSEPRRRLASRVLVPTAPSSVSEADRRCLSAPPSLFGRLRRHELIHGERSPSPFLPLFFRGTLSLAPSSSSPSQDCHQPPEPSPRRRTPQLIRFFSPSPSMRSSGLLSPPPPCPAGSLSAVGPRAAPFAPPLPL
jgi:hypothetical protein